MAHVVAVGPVVAPARLSGLDRLRGLAVLLMLVDHVCLVLELGNVFRYSAGRIAMPLFFLVAGSLVGRLGGRHLVVLGVGGLLPLFVPWIDSPNVLVLYVLGAAVLVLLRRLRLPLWLPVAVALAVMANGWNVRYGTSFDVLAAVALMACGALVSREHLSAWGAPLPWLCGWVGRRPLSWYVGHLLVLQLLVGFGVL